MLRFLTAGESHGQALVVIVDGMPAGVPIDIDRINLELARRQAGYGRGQRMQIERDQAQVLSGMRAGETLGSPIAVMVTNRDWKNWQRTMFVGPEPEEGASGANRAAVTRPRPGHADLAGRLKYDRADMRDILERASARETTMRVAAGAFARQFLGLCGLEVFSHVTRVGSAWIGERDVTVADIRAIAADAPIRCVDVEVEARMTAEIDAAKAAGDTLGGCFEVVVTGVPPGLGSYVQWDRKLDGRLAQALMSIPAIKAVGIGLGADVGGRPGSRVHDEIVLPSAEHPAPGGMGVARPTNRAGGLEGGVTNGEDLRATAVMKPISTLMKPLRSVDLATMEESPAAIERSDVCAISAAAVVGEAMVALVVADALLEKCGADTLDEVLAHLAHVRERNARHFTGPGLAVQHQE